MGISLTILPAYGRDYKDKQSVLESWQSGQDFRIAAPFEFSGQYVNRSDIETFKDKIPVSSVFIRYGKLRKILEIKLDN